MIALINLATDTNKNTDIATSASACTSHRIIGKHRAAAWRVASLALLLLFSAPLRSAEADVNILVLGDSLSAAFGIEEDSGWVALLQEALNEELLDHAGEVTVTNASISGDTTAGGLRRLPEAMEKFEPDIVIIELGGNDGLRGTSLKEMRQNLEEMANLALAEGARPLLLGMRIPTNYGPVYTKRFADAFKRVADDTGAELVPFFLAPIAEDINWFQTDGIHPNAAAQPLLMAPVKDKILEMLGVQP